MRIQKAVSDPFTASLSFFCIWTTQWFLSFYNNFFLSFQQNSKSSAVHAGFTYSVCLSFFLYLDNMLFVCLFIYNIYMYMYFLSFKYSSLYFALCGVSTYVGLYASGLFNLVPMLASQPCSRAFWVLTSLHLLPFLLKMFFYYSCYNFFQVYMKLCKLEKQCLLTVHYSVSLHPKANIVS